MLKTLSICALFLVGCNPYAKHPPAEKMNGLWTMEIHKRGKFISSDTLEIILSGNKLEMKYSPEKEYNTFLEPSYEDNTIRYHIYKNDTITYYEFKEIDLDESNFNYIEGVQYEGGSVEGWEERTENIILKKILK